MSKKEIQENAAQVEANSKIEAIKNLIFGENIAEYNHEFDTLKADLAEKRQELQDYIDDTRKELMRAIDNLSTDVNIRISDLESAMQERTDALEDKKVDRKLLGDLLIKMGETVQK